VATSGTGTGDADTSTALDRVVQVLGPGLELASTDTLDTRQVSLSLFMAESMKSAAIFRILIHFFQ